MNEQDYSQEYARPSDGYFALMRNHFEYAIPYVAFPFEGISFETYAAAWRTVATSCYLGEFHEIGIPHHLGLLLGLNNAESFAYRAQAKAQSILDKSHVPSYQQFRPKHEIKGGPLYAHDEIK